MMHYAMLSAAAVLTLACSSCRSKDPPAPASPPSTTITIHTSEKDTITIQAEVVATPKAREKGLMFRKELPDNTGMLFVFEDERDHSFWMKNTLVPLDILFIAGDKTVAGIIHEATPKSEKSLSVGLPSRYVLELPGGFCARNNIHRGNQLDWVLR